LQCEPRDGKNKGRESMKRMARREEDEEGKKEEC